MADKTIQSSEGKNERPALTPLDFSPLECRYESVAHYEYEKGKYVRIRVSGCHKTAVEQYIKELRINCEVIGYGSMQLSEEDRPTPEEETEQPVPQGELEQPDNPTDQQSTEDLEILIEGINAEGIESPAMVRLTLDPTINKDVSHTHPFKNNNQAFVTITAEEGKVAAELFQGQKSVNRKEVDMLPGEPPNTAILTQKVVPPASTNFVLRVTGKMNGSEYTLTGNFPLFEDIS
jgi:hypothetical protein